MINMRNYQGRDGKKTDQDKRRSVAISNDGGETWGELQFDSTLVEPICQASLIRVPSTGDDKSTILFSNPASTTGRHHLTIRSSLDAGKTWRQSRTLHPGPAAYSCLAILPDNSIGCLYESGNKKPYEKITFARFSKSWINK